MVSPSVDGCPFSRPASKAWSHDESIGECHSKHFAQLLIRYGIGLGPGDRPELEGLPPGQEPTKRGLEWCSGPDFQSATGRSWDPVGSQPALEP